MKNKRPGLDRRAAAFAVMAALVTVHPADAVETVSIERAWINPTSAPFQFEPVADQELKLHILDFSPATNLPVIERPPDLRWKPVAVSLCVVDLGQAHSPLRQLMQETDVDGMHVGPISECSSIAGDFNAMGFAGIPDRQRDNRDSRALLVLKPLPRVALAAFGRSLHRTDPVLGRSQMPATGDHAWSPRTAGWELDLAAVVPLDGSASVHVGYSRLLATSGFASDREDRGDGEFVYAQVLFTF